MTIQFHSSGEVMFEHYAEVKTKGRQNSDEGYRNAKRVLTRMMSNRDTRIHELQVEVAKSGN